MSTELTKLGRRMTIRQQALATAQIYIRRFYLMVEIRRTNPFLVVATALYLACKMEECPQHIRVIVSEARNVWPGMNCSSVLNCSPNVRAVDFVTTDVSKLGECEFFLISEMNCHLIVHHPYRDLTDLQKVMSMTQEEVSLAWSVINDHYLTDLPLLYPLHVIAATAILLAVTLKQPGMQVAEDPATAIDKLIRASKSTTMKEGENPQDKMQALANWLAKGEIDIRAMIDCTQEIISLYDVWESYNDKICREQIVRFVKARNLDK